MMFSSPIPGQSLTQSPDFPMPYERPPEFNDVEKAQAWVFKTLTEEDRVVELIELIARGVPIEVLAGQILFAGMANGKWNVDLLLLLIEPVIYILLFIAEQAGIEYQMSFEDSVDVDMETETTMMGHIEKTMKKIKDDSQIAMPSMLGGGGEI